MATARTTGVELEHLVDAALSRCRPGDGVGVLIGRLDRADVIVEAVGPGAAEALADALADRVADVIRFDDRIGRFGSHGWFALLEGLPTGRDLDLVAQRILTAARVRSSQLDDLITTSIGADISHDRRGVAAELVGRAAAACGSARAAGGDRLHRAGAGQAAVRLRLARELRRALDAGDLEVALAPIVPAPGRAEQPVRYEAVVRWRPPEGGSRPVPVDGGILLDGGLGLALGTELVSLACRAAAHRSEREGRPVTVGIDLDPSWFPDQATPLDDPGVAPPGAGLVDTVTAALARFGLDPGQLQLEINGKVLVAGSAAAVPMEALATLAAAGVRLAVDQLEPSLSVLEWLADDNLFQVWKLDRIVVEQLDRPLGRAALEAVAGLARERGVELVAQGVDGPDLAGLLDASGVTGLQGVAIGRPQPVDTDGRPEPVDN